MPRLTVDYGHLLALTEAGLTAAVTQDGQPVDLLIRGVTLDDIADFAAAEHMRA
ncbi:hypothetical protein NDR87_31570 [Nocardia sp. CDC159]|uniref:Uncharacterized protein n=1 Tax=Nocardia pulmonis TaxID=2951408 RepID=A0A9X2J1A9_9NOCA|nr:MULTISPECIES: hypothetical protein [Nocardia]MCM6777910.1 hypothetical protein [Nocardia pulmonis]MCM6790919.1 hypothetical protein [Nocardia sp. CDC159]